MTKDGRDTEVIRHDPRSRELARLQIRNGVNLRPGQRLHIKGMPVCCAGYARLLVEEAYEAGAADVTVSYDDAAISRLRYLHASDEALDDWYGYPAETVEKMIARGDCELVIFGSDPRAFEGCDPKRIRRANEARRKITEALDNAHVMMRIRRCTTAVPTPAWAREVFPDLSEEKALEALWDSVFAAFRITGDGKAADRWSASAAKARKRCRILTDAGLRALRYHSEIGTDIIIGLPPGHIWKGGSAIAKDGVDYYSNLPTEEIYTSPHKDQAEGIIVSSMPLYWMGNVIDGIRLTMRNGKVVEAVASKGQNLLRELLATDEGARHLGECALVGWDFPIRRLGISLRNMLFDENAACHFALGAGFPLSICGKDPVEAGVNDSRLHMDFMIGTEDLSVTGITEDGKELPIMRDGIFVE